MISQTDIKLVQYLLSITYFKTIFKASIIIYHTKLNILIVNKYTCLHKVNESDLL